MATYELSGTVKVVMDLMKFDSGFSKREFVVTTNDDRFPQDIKCECVKDRCAILNDIKPGQRVKVTFDLRGNENKGRYFVSLSAWKVETAQEHAAPDAQEESSPFDQRIPPPEEHDDGLSFP